MKAAKSASWARMTLALAAALMVGGTGLVFANPDPTYKPVSSQLIGKRVVAPNTTEQYVFRVKFTDGSTCDFGGSGGQTGATFGSDTTKLGTIDSNGSLTVTAAAPSAGVISGTFSQAGATTTAQRTIFVR